MSESDAAGYASDVIGTIVNDLEKRADEAAELARISYEDAEKARREGDRFAEIAQRCRSAHSAFTDSLAPDAECVMAKASTR